MKTLSVDLRKRILDSYDAHEGTRLDMAQRYKVSLGLVKKLIQQRKKTGDIAPRHRFSGRKPMILDQHRNRMKQELVRRPDLTLGQLRKAVGLSCSLPAIHYALSAMNLTYKKRRSGPASRTGRT
jgi:transposase